MEVVGGFIQEHPVLSFSIASFILGGPFLGGRGLKARHQLFDGSIARKTGYFALWFGFFVWIVREWPTVSRILAWVLRAGFGLAVLAVFAMAPQSELARFSLIVSFWFAVIWFWIWFGGADREITLDNIREVRHRKGATTAVRQSLAATTPDGTPPRAGTAHETANGDLVFAVEPGIGGTLEGLAEAASSGALGNAVNQLGHRHGVGDLTVTSSVVSSDGDIEGQGQLVVHLNGDPLLNTTFAPPEKWEGGTNDPIVLGVDEMGNQLKIDLEDEFRMLIAGLSGMGKSVEISGIVDQLAPREDTALVLCDPKEQEFAPYAGRASTVGLGTSGCDLVLRLVYCEYLRRKRALRPKMSDAGEIQSEYIRKNRTGIDFPRLVTIVDEVAEVAGIKKPSNEYKLALKFYLEEQGYAEEVANNPEAYTEPADEILRKIVTLTRSTGMTTIVATQRPDTSVLPGNIRDNCDMALSFALRDKRAVTMVFGDASPPCHLIPVDAKGVGYALTQESRTPTKFRSYLVDDDRVLSTAATTRDLRVDLGWPRIIERPASIPVDLDEE